MKFFKGLIIAVPVSVALWIIIILLIRKVLQ
jgi:uncharacterized membrane protein